MDRKLHAPHHQRQGRIAVKEKVFHFREQLIPMGTVVVMSFASIKSRTLTWGTPSHWEKESERVAPTLTRKE